MTDANPLHRLKRLSRPIAVLLSIALALLVLVEVPAIVAILFFFDGDGAWRAAVSFSEVGVNLAIFASGDPVRAVPLDALGFGQRSAIAALAALCAACGGLAIFHLRQLFALYSRGIVFAAENIRHIKRFGLWLVVAGIAINGSGRVFFLVTSHHPDSIANAAMAIVYGGMTFAIARVMELGREADLERNAFV